MAMLAEPRQRKRYNLVPRGKALYEDDANFGTKMLEKMGWSKGKGLGAKENGNKDFVRVRYKNDAQGLGYEDRDDQWTQHEEGFNGLLQTLNGESGSNPESANGQEDVLEEETGTIGFGFVPETKQKKGKLKEKFSGESLEEKSKQSKARVHYKKFTRGKDLTRYSEKDLANILGKKLDENNGFKAFSAITVEQQNGIGVNIEENKANSKFSGVQTMTSELSVADYFKQKMETMRNKLKNATENGESTNEVKKKLPVIEENAKKLNKRDKKKREVEEEQLDADNEMPKKKKKKKDKVGKDDEKKIRIETIEVPEKITKKIKQKESIESMVETRTVAADHEEIKQEVLAKKKKKKTFEEKGHILEKSTTPGESLKQKTKKPIVTESSPQNIDRDTVNENSTQIKSLDGKKLNNIKIPGDKSKKRAQDVKEKSNSVKNTGNKSKKESSVVATKIRLEEPTNAAESSHEDSTEEIIKISSNSNVSKHLAQLSHEELKDKLDSYNVYTISTFSAEKFRNSDLTRFGGATISHIPGYSFNDDLQLNIRTIKGDEKRIMKLWDCTLKYANAAPRNTYTKYAKQLYNARKAKLKKLPRFNVKTWKRKQAFQGLQI